MMHRFEQLLAAAFLAAVVFNVGNVVARYIFGVSLSWADEIQIFILMWMTFGGAAVASWRNAHLRMDVLAKYLPRGLQVAIRSFERMLTVAVSGIAAWHSMLYVHRIWSLGQLSDNAGIPMWFPHSAVAVGLGICLLIAASPQRFAGGKEA